ncbi:MAG: ABC transporter ATP-binding protein [Gammaproteobacteria bacterium]|nr:MAG: ABC transporter ATP-binding protein [Gammaproteobacteria bacterium]
MSFIQIKNITKNYTNRRRTKRSPGDASKAGELITVLDNINLEFEEGEMVCILGPSGCGKSTLLRIIAGFDTDFDGEVIIDGDKVGSASSEHIFVFQQNGLLPWMSVWDNVELGLRNMKDSEMKNEQIQEYIDLVELNGFEHNLPYQLSGGMQRRAELARALAVTPDILYLDEPFTGLDYFTHLKVREEVVNIHEYIGKTMIMVTHFIEDALVMADRIIILSDRPSCVKMTRKLDFSRPRNMNKNKDLGDLRDEIFLMLGVSYVA